MDLQRVLDAASLAGEALPDAWLELSPGEQLRRLRQFRDVSQRQLADAVGVQASVISRLESGADARLSTWLRLVSVLGFTPALLPIASTDDEWLDVMADEKYARRRRQEEGLATGKRRF